MLEFTTRSARAAGIPVAMCGEMAADPAYAAILLALGLDELSMAPSEYVKRQVWATFQFEDVWIDTRKRFDMNKIMWSSDYPHTDSPWPHSKEYIAEHFKGAPAEDLVKVVGGNAATLYSIS